jgi:ATP-binding cassette subfamily B protein
MARAYTPVDRSSERFTWRGSKERLRLANRGLALAWESSPKLSAAIFALTVAASLLAPAMAYVGKLIVDAVVAGSAERVIRFVALEFLLLAASSAIQRALYLCRSLLGSRLGITVNAQVLEKALSVDLPRMEDPDFYDKMNRARMEASSRSMSLVTDAFQLVQNALILLGYISLLLSFSRLAVLAMILASVPATIAEMRFSQQGFRLFNWRSPERRKMSYLEIVLATDNHAKEVRMFGFGREFFARYLGFAEKFYDEDRALSSRRSIWATVLSLLSSLSFYGCYLWTALSASRGAISLGTLTLYVTAFRQGQQAFQSCLSSIGGMYEHTLYLSNLFEFLAMPSGNAAPSLPNAQEIQNSPPAAGIYFDNVSFRYPGKSVFALEHVRLHIPTGKSLAVVGSNGAGKSTLIKLLCGLYPPTAGKIWIHGREIRDWDPAELRTKISVVFQDYNKYQLTLEENVTIGLIGSSDRESRALRAMDKGGARDFISDLPEGLQTPLGNWFSGGRELSGGQWQKVAVSRAFMREEAELVIFDEPTAALDPESESMAFERFRELTRGRTSLIISHRFPMARLADQIIVMEHGRIVEQGSHGELIQQAGRYAQLFALQARGYQEELS